MSDSLDRNPSFDESEERTLGIKRYTALADYYDVMILLLQLPNEEFVSAIHEGSLTVDYSSICDELDITPDRYSPVVEQIKNVERMVASEDDALAALRSDFTRMFSHPTHPCVMSCQAIFMDSERVRKGLESTHALDFVNPIAMDVSRVYRRAGFKRSNGENIPADNICTELEFMKRLRMKAAKACIESDISGVEASEKQADAFKSQYMSAWMPAFFARCEKEGRGTLYAPVGSMGLLLMEIEKVRVTSFD